MDDISRIVENLTGPVTEQFVDAQSLEDVARLCDAGRQAFDECINLARFETISRISLTDNDVEEILTSSDTVSIKAMINNPGFNVKKRNEIALDFAKTGTSARHFIFLEELAKRDILGEDVVAVLWQEIDKMSANSPTRWQYDVPVIMAHVLRHQETKKAQDGFGRILEAASINNLTVEEEWDVWSVVHNMVEILGDMVGAQYAELYRSIVAEARANDMREEQFLRAVEWGSQNTLALLHGLSGAELEKSSPGHLESFLLGIARSGIGSGIQAKVTRAVCSSAVRRGVLKTMDIDNLDGDELKYIADLIVDGATTAEIAMALRDAKGGLHKAIVYRVGCNKVQDEAGSRAGIAAKVSTNGTTRR